MAKQAISFTLTRDNIIWLRARAAAEGRRSVSETLDVLIAEVRGVGDTEPRSVVGTVTIPEDDPDLATADATIRSLFTEYIASDEGSELKPPGGRNAA